MKPTTRIWLGVGVIAACAGTAVGVSTVAFMSEPSQEASAEVVQPEPEAASFDWLAAEKQWSAYWPSITKIMTLAEDLNVRPMQQECKRLLHIKTRPPMPPSEKIVKFIKEADEKLAEMRALCEAGDPKSTWTAGDQYHTKVISASYEMYLNR